MDILQIQIIQSLTPVHYSTRHTMSGVTANDSDERLTTPTAPAAENHLESNAPHNNNISPYDSPKPKSVAFELLFPESPQFRARLPMRVQIFPHDTTDSIVTTVKNFYGLYAGPGGPRGISFEDEQGNTLIARYENLRNNMVVYVRLIDDSAHTPIAFGPTSCNSASPIAQQGYYDEALQMLPPQPTQVLNYGQPPSRPTSRTSIKRSVSPSGRGRRSASASTNPPPTKKTKSRSGYKSRGSSAHGSFVDMYSDAMNGYSSGDGAPGSVSSRTKSEHLGNTEISIDNIVEGGRRKRAKFESSVSKRPCVHFPCLLFNMLIISFRNSLSSRRHRYQPRPQILLSLPLGELSITEHRFPLHNHHR